MRVQATIYVERNGQELELALIGSYQPSDPGHTTGSSDSWYAPVGAEADLEGVLLSGHPWSGNLSAEEEALAVEALLLAGDESVYGGGED